MTGETCKSCRALIVWGLTPKGKRIPLDAAPNEKGNMIITNAGQVVCVREAELFDPPGMRYFAHFVTCPQADQWRRPQ